MLDSPKGGAPWGPADDEEIEILEVVGLDEAGKEPEASDEIELVFEEEPGAPAKPRGKGAAAVETPPDAGRERFLRLQADFENLRKRLERERDEFSKYATGDLVSRLLVVLDNFERALAAGRESGGDAAFRDGISLIHRQLYDELCKEGIAAVDSVGEAFDPTVHEAVATDTTSTLPPNTIVEELQRGYYLNGRLLRPALVRVVVPRDPDGAWDPRKER